MGEGVYVPAGKRKRLRHGMTRGEPHSSLSAGGWQSHVAYMVTYRHTKTRPPLAGCSLLFRSTKDFKSVLVRVGVELRAPTN
jgi:hypothetical protein